MVVQLIAWPYRWPSTSRPAGMVSWLKASGLLSYPGQSVGPAGLDLSEMLGLTDGGSGRQQRVVGVEHCGASIQVGRPAVEIVNERGQWPIGARTAADVTSMSEPAVLSRLAWCISCSPSNRHVILIIV